MGLGAHTHGPGASVSSHLPRPPQPGIGRGRGWGAASPSLCAKALGPTRRCQEAPAQPWGAVAGAVSGGWVGSGRPPPPGSAEGQGFQAGCPVLGGRVPRVVPAPVRGRGRGPHRTAWWLPQTAAVSVPGPAPLLALGSRRWAPCPFRPDARAWPGSGHAWPAGRCHPRGERGHDRPRPRGLAPAHGRQWESPPVCALCPDLPWTPHPSRLSSHSSN